MDERQDNPTGGTFAEQIPNNPNNPNKRFSTETRNSEPGPELKVGPEIASAALLPVEDEGLASTRSENKSNKQKKNATVESIKVTEPLTQMPRIYIGLIYAAFGFLMVAALSPRAMSSLDLSFWAAIPMQIYLAYCMLRYSDLIGLKNKTRAPLSQFAVMLICLIAFVCRPQFGDGMISQNYGYPNRLTDPFWILWSFAQVVWPFLLSLALEKKLALRTWIVTAASAAPVFALSILQTMFNMSFFFVPLWFISQFGCLVYFAYRLRQVYAEDLNVLNAKLAKVKEQVFGVSKEDIVIRYRPYAAVERWLRQRFTGGDLLKGAKLIMLWLSVPAVIGILIVALMALDFALNNSGFAQQHLPKAAAQAMANNTGMFIRAFLAFVALLVSVPTFLYLKAPTHIAFNRKGQRFLWRHGRFARDGNNIDWQNLDLIEIERPPGSTQALDQSICFRSRTGEVNKIKLSAIDSIEDREKLLAMIRHWAPNVPRPPEVEQALEPPANHSYTEMWLQALAAPPKRERLKPLLDGGSLQAGKYRVINQLGVGGQGSAYLANDNINDHTVVLKEFILPVHVDVTVRKSALESFENEARILKQMDSQNVVKLIDFFVEDHRAYLVLEHIDGASLRELVEKNGAMAESQVKELAIQMCSILSYLHSLSPPVVHRDFTPDNLILQKDGTLKLIDFNVAQQVEATVTGTVVGKHAYLPPEQFRGMPTSQSDIYACGATLHFLLTGADPEPISKSHPAKQVPGLSNGMDHIVSHATQLDCAQRYENIEQMADDLKTLT
jgi:predicted Ser/Thr protein kinase